MCRAAPPAPRSATGLVGLGGWHKGGTGGISEDAFAGAAYQQQAIQQCT